MSHQSPPSPVAPPTRPRPWTAAVGVGVCIAALLGLAALRPDDIGYLLAGAALAMLAVWAVVRRTPVARIGAAPETAPAEPVADRALLDGLFEALADPVLVVSGGEADDIGDRRVVLANAAARELLRIPREGALLVSALRDPAVPEAVDEALFGGVARSTDYGGVGAQARHWRALTRPLPSTDGRALALMVLRDETEVRRMELMRVDFLANASHELRTPLASLSGFIETL